MPTTPTPRFTSLSDFEDYLNVQADSTAKAVVLPSILASAERVVERYCRRRFAPDPPLADSTSGYQRRVVQISGAAGSPGAGGLPPATGSFRLSFGGQTTAPLSLPLDAPTLQAAFTALSSVGAGKATASGGPLPSWPLSITFAGALSGAQGAIAADSSGLSGGYVTVLDAGFDSAPPITRRFSTRGKTVLRVPDLRLVDASPDPRVPGSGGIMLAGRRLLPNQYYLGSGGYAEGGADEALGEGSYAEPATEITLGYGYASGFSLAAQFAYALPTGYMGNDLAITGRWGWNPTPEAIIDAVYALGARRYRERDAAFSDALQTGEGTVLSFYKQLPPAVLAVLEGYRVANWAVV